MIYKGIPLLCSRFERVSATWYFGRRRFYHSLFNESLVLQDGALLFCVPGLSLAKGTSVCFALTFKTWHALSHVKGVLRVSRFIQVEPRSEQQRRIVIGPTREAYSFLDGFEGCCQRGDDLSYGPRWRLGCMDTYITFRFPFRLCRTLFIVQGTTATVTCHFWQPPAPIRPQCRPASSVVQCAYIRSGEPNLSARAIRIDVGNELTD